MLSTALNTLNPTTDLRELLLSRSELFWQALCTETAKSNSFEHMMSLSVLRRKALNFDMNLPSAKSQKLAILGSYTFYPFHELVTHLLNLQGVVPELWLGNFDNYMVEILDEKSELYAFNPQWLFLMISMPQALTCLSLTDSEAEVRAKIEMTVSNIVALCAKIQSRTKSEIILCNFIPPPSLDPGPIRCRNLASLWSATKALNLELGLRMPSQIHLCDIELLAVRRGLINCVDARAWLESKQPCSPSLLLDLAREICQIMTRIHLGPKKVLVTDLDDTLWGGPIGDLGIEGIELGDTNARGQAFKLFQKYLKSLYDRGVLLAVCSKNTDSIALEPFENHSEMALKREHIASFKANWKPKSENIMEIAKELNLGLDSFVFIDDNPMEIDHVKTFLPQVSCLQMGPDPADYISQLQDARFFEISSLTQEDLIRTASYRQNFDRETALATMIDMDSYLKSLQMVAEISDFCPVDIARITQLINKSNQFNLTTKRRSESEIKAIMTEPGYHGFTVRLRDKFGDHGLVAIVILNKEIPNITIDTWLMSCRVLNRQIEWVTLNEIVTRATTLNTNKVIGTYLATPKNSLVKDHYDKLGFVMLSQDQQSATYELQISGFREEKTHITVEIKS